MLLLGGVDRDGKADGDTGTQRCRAETGEFSRRIQTQRGEIASLSLRTAPSERVISPYIRHACSRHTSQRNTSELW